MGRDLFEHFPESQEVFQAADRVLGFSLSSLCFDGPEEQLKLTENTQPAILAASMAAWKALSARGVRPDFVAGHSLGEYSALVAAGVLSLEEAILLVRHRGRYMQEAVPVGQGSMAAILGLDASSLEAVCRDAEQGQIVSPANYNSAQQIVIAGHKEAVDRAVVLARERGAKRGILLPVSAPFHCPLMQPAQERLAADLQNAAFAPPCCPVVCNVSALPVLEPDVLREGLIRQVSQAVRWQQSMEFLLREGVTVFMEVGPGKVLSGLLKKLPEGIRVLGVEDASTLAAALQELEIAQV